MLRIIGDELWFEDYKVGTLNNVQQVPSSTLARFNALVDHIDRKTVSISVRQDGSYYVQTV